MSGGIVRIRCAIPEPLAEPPADTEAIPQLRFLKLLVGALAVVMGAGIIAIVALLWLRLSPAVPGLPPSVVLPDGVRAEAVTFARDWTVIVTQTGEVLVYDGTGGLRQRVTLQR